MTRPFALALSALLSASTVSFAQNEQQGNLPAPQQESPFKTHQERYSYCIGLDVAQNLQNQALNLDLRAFVAGLKTIFMKEDPLMSPEEIRSTMEQFGGEMQQRQDAELAEMKKRAAENKAAAEAFLATNKAREEVTTTASGLQYEVVERGNGKTPTQEDVVTVHYTGKLEDGTTFDTSREPRVEGGPVEPAQFGVTQVIPGWTEALQLMREGDKFRLYIHPDLAYGDADSGPIPAGSLLIFDVELLKVDE